MAEMSTTPARLARPTSAWSKETNRAPGGLPGEMHRIGEVDCSSHQPESGCN